MTFKYFLRWNMILAAALLIIICICITFFRPSPDTLNLSSLHVSKQTLDTADMIHGKTFADALFDYKYNAAGNVAPNTKVMEDPCIDIPLTNDGATADSGEGITVLVTGGAGFIGSNLVDRLLALGYKVKILDNLYTGFIRNVPLQSKNVEFIFGDILNIDDLKKAVEGVQFVYHLAAMSKVLPSLNSSAMARFCTESNALGSWNVLEAVREQGNVKKVIYAASSTYYGNNPTPHREDMAADFLSPYAMSKYEGELQMQMFDRLFGVPTISTRFFMVYGQRQPSTGAYAIVTGVFAKQAAQGQKLTIEGDGSHYRDFIHVNDVVEGLILSQQSPNLRGDVINLGTGTAFSVQQVADLVSKDQVFTEARENDLEGTLADTCKMKHLLNYKAKAVFETEMAYMAEQTMEGNMFIQDWLTPIHALSAPHLLPPGTPVFKWPTDQSDLDSLLLACEDFKKRAQVDLQNTAGRVSVIPFAAAKEDVELIGDLILNTIFSLVRFGGVKTYIVAAHDGEALASCITLNLPCYDVQLKGAPALLTDLLSRGYDVHLARLGNSYVHDVNTTLEGLLKKSGLPDIITSNPEGDVFIRTNSRTRAAVKEWSWNNAMPRNDSRAVFAIDNWQYLGLKKAEYSAEQFCNLDKPALLTPSGQNQTNESSDGWLQTICTLDKAALFTPLSQNQTEESPSDEVLQSICTLDKSTVLTAAGQNRTEGTPSDPLLLQAICTLKPSGRNRTEGTPSNELEAICKMDLYAAIGCPEFNRTIPQNANSTIKALKSIGAWHLHSCENAEKCDRQQIVPLRWLSHPPNLAAVENLCESVV